MALFGTGFYRDFVGICSTQRIPDRVSILRFSHLLEAHALSPKILQVINAKLAACGPRWSIRLGWSSVSLVTPKVRYRGLKKNAAQRMTLFALSNLWMARCSILQGVQAWVRLQTPEGLRKAWSRLETALSLPAKGAITAEASFIVADLSMPACKPGFWT